MTDLLLRLFVKDHHNTASPKVRAALGALAGWVGIGCNLLLFAIKLLAGTLSGSVSITADALNNLSDASGFYLDANLSALALHSKNHVSGLVGDRKNTSAALGLERYALALKEILYVLR